MIKKIINYCSIIAVLVIVTNAFFIVPSADDYSYFVKQNDYGFWKFQQWHYLNWGGRYIPNIVLGSFDYNGYGLYVYRMIAIVIILGLYLSLLLFVKKIIQPKSPLLFANVLFVGYCFSLYSISQEFYWMPGSITYTLSLILCLLSWTIIEKSNKIPYLILLIVMAIVINGTNEITMLLYNASIVGYLILKFIKTKKINYSVGLLLIISTSCMSASILAPGNTVRTLSETNPNTHNFTFSIVRALYRTLTFTLEKFFIFIFIALYLGTQLRERNLKIIKSKIHPWLLIVICVIFPFSVLCFGIFPSYYATGRIPPERTVNTIVFFFMIAIIFSLQVYKDHTSIVFNEKSTGFRLLPIGILLIIAIYPNELRSNFIDLFSGRSIQFAREMQKREEYIKSEKSDDIVVERNTTLPNTLLFKDISGDKDSFFNHYYARFYHKKSIIVNEK